MEVSTPDVMPGEGSIRRWLGDNIGQRRTRSHAGISYFRAARRPRVAQRRIIGRFHAPEAIEFIDTIDKTSQFILTD